MRASRGEIKIEEILRANDISFQQEYTFRDLNSISGKSDVMFIFLPGSNFSMKWFRFY